ncbi:MAG: tetratricopeptide repeat protein [Burkholderiaceae bacterium]
MNRQTLARIAAVVALVVSGMITTSWISDLVAYSRASISADQIGHQLLRENRAYDAALVFDDPAWKGVALFRAERFQRAAAEFSLQDSVLAQYNLGVSYAYLKRYKDAESTFRAVLAREPDHEDARHNLNLLRELENESNEQDQSGQSADQGEERKQAGDSGSENLDSESMAAPNLKQEQAQASSGDSKRDPSEINPEQATGTKLGGSGSQERLSELLKKLQEQEPGQANNSDDTTEKPDEAGRGAQDQPAAQSELAIADQVRYRGVVDRPEVVLRARLKAAASIRQGRVEAVK